VTSPLVPPFTLHRVVDPRVSPVSTEGARLYGGRWNAVGLPVLYAATSFAGALLEALVHAGGGGLPARIEITIDVPRGVTVERIDGDELPGWDSPDMAVSRAAGERWLRAARSAVLIVPSMVGRPHERNAVLNPAHREFERLVISEARGVKWDGRIGGTSAARR
jgi:RES domain-containing protein